MRKTGKSLRFVAQNDKLRQYIVRAFVKCKPEKIILFGSWANGTADCYSDVDLIVVMRTNKRFLDRLAELYEMWSFPMPVDILAYTPEEFSSMSHAQNSFMLRVSSEGVVIYEKPIE